MPARPVRISYDLRDGFTQATGAPEDLFGLLELLVGRVERITMCADTLTGDASVCWGDSPFEEEAK